MKIDEIWVCYLDKININDYELDGQKIANLYMQKIPKFRSKSKI